MQNIEFTRNFIELHNAENYTLSIRITSNGFCFCILDNSTKKLIFFKNVIFNPSFNISTLEQLKQLINIDPIFNYPLGKSNIVYAGQNYTLIPSELFETKYAEEYFCFAHKLEENEKIVYEQIKGSDIFNIYSLPKDLLEFLQQKFPNVPIHHQNSMLINDTVTKEIAGRTSNDKAGCRESSVNEVKPQSQKVLHIDVFPDFFYAVITEQGKLILSNSIAYANTNEFVYFIINLFDKFNLNQNESRLFISGDIEKADEKIEILSKYIEQIIFEEETEFSFVDEFQKIEIHKLTKLFKQCEL
jgi:hypothetical protein